jgi:anaerobic selenocysteine-containing dehydrogenase
MAAREARSFCRICGGLCGMRIAIDADERIVAIKPDKQHPITQGYACSKGLEAGELHQGPTRLLHPLKRRPDGSFARIGLEQALDEIAERLTGILERRGPAALAAYRGTPNWFHAVGTYFLPAWLRSLGGWKYFSTYTIDQSAKWVTMERLGNWAGGRLSLAEADVWLFAGTNPLVSVGSGYLLNNPSKSLKAAKERGLRLIVIDPRRTETAARAEVHLQIRPGEDPTVAAGLIHVILNRGWHDAAFCARHVAGLEALRGAVAPFTPEYVAARAGIEVSQLLRAAELFAGEGRRGAATTGTGPNMSPRSNLSEHLYECLNVICARYPQAGDVVSNPGVLSPRTPRVAQAIAPSRAWERGYRSRVRSMGMLYGEMMTGVLPEEILTPGEDQIRTLFVTGGNPAGSSPDTAAMAKALSSLELLVTIDPLMSATARLSHYVLPPKLMYEIPAVPCLDMELFYYGQPYAQYTPAIVTPPQGSDVADDSYLFWSLAARMRRPIEFRGVTLDLDKPPDLDDLLSILLRDAQVPFQELKRHPIGSRFDVPPQVVEAARDDGARFEVMPKDVEVELAAVRTETSSFESADYSHRLLCRRMREVSNTMRDLPSIRRRRKFNPAYLAPSDLATYGIAAGDRIEIVSAHGCIPAIVAVDEGLLPGTISMTHGWGGLPDENLPYDTEGANPSFLIKMDAAYEAINAMPTMSTIPVNIRKAGLGIHARDAALTDTRTN